MMHYGSTVAVAEIAPSAAIYGNGRRRDLARRLRELGMAVFDRMFATVLLLLLAPLFLVVAAAILIADGRPVFFGHERIGRDGRVFKCLKFRTMVRDAEARLEAMMEADPALRAEYLTSRKLAHDPRILPFGHLLRRLSIDELPQFWNVLRGDMAIVGPRPCTPGEIGLYGAGARTYASVRPGVTGLWQVSGRADVTFEERIRLDLEYVRSRGVAYDARILLKTPMVVLRRSGAC